MITLLRHAALAAIVKRNVITIEGAMGRNASVIELDGFVHDLAEWMKDHDPAFDPDNFYRLVGVKP